MARFSSAALGFSLALALPAGPAEAAPPDPASNPGPPAASAAPSAAAAPRALNLSGFNLFPLLLPAGLQPREGNWSVDVATERLLHRAGDPDSVFSLGGDGPSGEARLAAAVEVNEALLRVTAPDPRVSASDPRGRLTGTYLPLDSAGRPYQFRLGARLVW